MTRDSLLWTITFVSSVLTFLANSLGLLHMAFPMLGATADARIAFAAAIAGFVSGYMKMSPLPLSYHHPLATRDANTVLSPVNSSKVISLLLALTMIGMTLPIAGCASTLKVAPAPPAGTYTPAGDLAFNADQLLKDLQAVSETAINLNAQTGKLHLSDHDTVLIRDFALSAGAALQSYGTGGTTLQTMRDAYGRLMQLISVDGKQQPALAVLLASIGGALNQVK